MGVWFPKNWIPFFDIYVSYLYPHQKVVLWRRVSLLIVSRWLMDINFVSVTTSGSGVRGCVTTASRSRKTLITSCAKPVIWHNRHLATTPSVLRKLLGSTHTATVMPSGSSRRSCATSVCNQRSNPSTVCVSNVIRRKHRPLSSTLPKRMTSKRVIHFRTLEVCTSIFSCICYFYSHLHTHFVWGVGRLCPPKKLIINLTVIRTYIYWYIGSMFVVSKPIRIPSSKSPSFGYDDTQTINYFKDKLNQMGLLQETMRRYYLTLLTTKTPAPLYQFLHHSYISYTS